MHVLFFLQDGASALGVPHELPDVATRTLPCPEVVPLVFFILLLVGTSVSIHDTPVHTHSLTEMTEKLMYLGCVQCSPYGRGKRKQKCLRLCLNLLVE